MQEPEIIELLKAAKPLVQSRFSPHPNIYEKEALFSLESLLRQVDYNQNLIYKGGWTLLELTILREKLDSYMSL